MPKVSKFNEQQEASKVCRSLPLHPVVVQPKIWCQVGMDLIGLMPETPRENKYIITLANYFSMWAGEETRLPIDVEILPQLETAEDNLDAESHWLIVSTIGVSTPAMVRIYDSLNASLPMHTKKQIATILHTKDNLGICKCAGKCVLL